jgi:hypothetical protein
MSPDDELDVELFELTVEDICARVRLGIDAMHEVRNGDPLTGSRLHLIAEVDGLIEHLQAITAEVAVDVLMTEIDGGRNEST